MNICIKKWNKVITNKSKFILFVTLLTCTHAQAQINYIRTFDATAPEQNATALMGRWVSDVKTTTQYIDGLGRPIQTVMKQGSLQSSNNEFADMVSTNVYDEFGREQFKYLPFAANNAGGNTAINNGAYKTNALAQQQAFATAQYPGENNFYGKTNFEPSPLNRPINSYAPGTSWAGSETNTDPAQRRNVQMKYYINTAVDDVRIWNVNNNATIGNFGTYTTPSAYPAGELYKNITIDEHKKQVIEFKNKEGKVILKKVQLTAADDNGAGANNAGWLCTYYIYDDLNNLRCVIQPEGVKQLAGSNWQLATTNTTAYTTLLAEQCFRYEYDARNRMIKKKVPGAGEVCMVYDARDRLVLTQDANMRTAAQKKWIYTKYDELNRPICTGLITDPTNYTNYAYHYGLAYNSITYPDLSLYTTKEELSASFYDNYTWLANFTTGLSATYNTAYDTYFQTASNTTWPYAQANTKSEQVKGMATGSRTKVLGTANTYLYSLVLYDAKGRAIQSQATNITGAVDITTTQYTWAGQPLVMVSKQQNAAGTGQTTVTVSQMTYDDLGRVIKSEKKLSNTLVNGGAMVAYKTIAENKYDKLGQLVEKRLAPTSPTAQLETEKFDYNIRGWLLGMNREYMKEWNGVTNNYFGFDLGYDKTDNNSNGSVYLHYNNNPQYNGNIEGSVWKSKGDGKIRRYDFNYDAANRIISADFNQISSGYFNKNDNVDFSLSNMSYDYNGNILSMTQKGLKISISSVIDNLKYSYIAGTNKLKNVTDISYNNVDLGDFKTNITHPQHGVKNSLNASSPQASFDAITDYAYDDNGNLNIDNNKNIGNVMYNHLNLPTVITIPNKGNITYTYDAGGNKLRKVTLENSTPNRTITTTTNYINGLVYESKTTVSTPVNPNDPLNYTDVLQFVPQEEGRIRFKPAVGALPASFAYDYMLKDHLGNVRVVITEEQQQDIYPAATLEDVTYNGGTAISQEQKYYDINPAKIVLRAAATGIPNYTNQNIPAPPNNNPNSNTAANSAKLYMLNSTSGLAADKMGLGITLKVMAGDRIDVAGKSYYFQQTAGQGGNNTLLLANILTGFLGGASGAGATNVHGAVSEPQINPGTTNPSLNSLLNTQTTQSNASPNNPRAFINVIFFDEQFNAIDFKVSKVGDANVLKENHLQDLQNLVATKSGFVYVYVSNESPVNVFFDNVQVVHTRGALIEESSFYAFGLKMDGISSRAAGSMMNKDNTFQEQKFDDDLGINYYSFKWRNHDPQIGRFIEIDPLSEKYVYNSTYAFSENKVTGHRELEGLEAWSVNPVTLADGSTVMSATVSNINAPFSVTQGGVTTGFFPNADMNRQLGGAIVSNGSLLVPTNANGDYNSYSGEGISNFNYMTSNLAATPAAMQNVITNGIPVVINGNRNATGPMATVGATTVTTPAITSATAPTVNLTYSDQAGLPNTFTVTDNTNRAAAPLINTPGRGSITTTAPNFVSGGTMSVRTTEQPRQRGDGYNFTLTVTPTVATPTLVATPAAVANQLRIKDDPKSKSLLNNVALPNR
jgi:RHS repeat-associated protein